MSEEKRTDAYEKEAAQYCSQNNQDCLSCSLVNYGMDCHNNQIHDDKNQVEVDRTENNIECEE